jgi:uncharacterized protein
VETHFEEVITIRQRLRELSSRARGPATRLSITLTTSAEDFIAACPFVMVASRGADGRMELSPKGDPPGFVAALDEKTRAFPDRPGNHWLDTFKNLAFVSLRCASSCILARANGGRAAAKKR